jgi:thioredoxin 1
MKTITSEQLKQKIENKENFYLDIKASWCGPCKVLLKNLQEVTSQHSEDLPVYVFDVDDDREFAMEKLNIRSVPTTKLFKDGEEVYNKVGILMKEEINELINRI